MIDPLNELRDGLVAAAQRQTEENTMDGLTASDLRQLATEMADPAKEKALLEKADRIDREAAAQRQEVRMNTATVPQPRSDVRSMFAIYEGGKFVVVDYRDNSDIGRAQEFYDNSQAALARASALIREPPCGNYFHPAPDALDLRIYAVERLVAPRTDERGGTFVPGDDGYWPGHASECSCDPCAADSQRDYPEGG